MQELVKDIEKVVDGHYETDLTQTAVKFSEFCLRNLKGDLLGRGMAICAALVAFEDGLKHPEVLKD